MSCHLGVIDFSDNTKAERANVLRVKAQHRDMQYMHYADSISKYIRNNNDCMLMMMNAPFFCEQL